MDGERIGNMKNIKKILAILVVAMIVAASMTMAVSEQTKDSSIKVTGLAEGDKVTLYKVLDWVGDKATAQTWGGWAVANGFTGVIATSDALGNIIDDLKTGYTGLTSEVAGDLSRAGATPVTGQVNVTVGADGEYTYSPAELGMYMAIITPADLKTVYNPVFISADYTPGNNEWGVTEESTYYGESAAKKSTVTLEKSSTNEEDTELGTNNSEKGDTTKPGDTLTFTVKTTIPGYGNTFEHPRFFLKDTMDTLAYQQDITIKAGSKDLVKDTDYTIVESDENHYKISFTETYLKSLKVPTAITATYTAKVKALPEGTYENVEKEQNTVEIQYSHDPSTETDGKPGGDLEYKKDITNHYTFSIDANNIGGKPGAIGESMTEIIKVAVDREGNPIYSEKLVSSTVTTTETVKSPLAGAKFELKDSSGKVVGTAVSDEKGRLLFEGLDEGTYTLVETEAPTGFVKDTSEHTIVIDAVLEEKTYTEWYDQKGTWYSEAGEGRTKYEYKADELVSYTITFDGETVGSHTFDHDPEGSSEIKWSSSKSSEAPSSIHNTKGVELPSTGGIGTTIFYVGGSILVLAAAILLVTKRRMSVEE